MAYIGNKADVAFTSLLKQDLTGASGQTLTLSHAVANENDIALYINNVRQEPISAYTASNVTVNLTGTVSGTDDIYVIYLARAVQTTVPPDGSVTSAKLDTNIAVSGNLDVTGAFTSQGIDDNADATAVTIDSSERIMIGTTTEGEANADNFTVSGSGNVGMTIRSTSSNEANIYFSDGTSGGDEYRGFISYNHSDNSLRLGSDASERMRIDSSGSLLLSSTSQYGAKLNVVFNGSGASPEGDYRGITITPTATNSTTYLHFHNTGVSTIGSITGNGSNIAYNTSSDYRLKENVEDMTGAIDRVKQLSPKRFNFIADETNTLFDGFLAHEAQSVVAEAVTGTHNEVDDDGNAVMQGIDQAKIVPLLTGALKEAIAKIEALETRITALENS
jgi:hypothetical protein